MQSGTQLNGKVAFVTGGGQGIGASVAKAFAREGAMVAVIDVTLDSAAGVANEIADQGGEALGVAYDVADREQVEMAVSQVDAAWGRVDILVNNAGITRGDAAQDDSATVGSGHRRSSDRRLQLRAGRDAGHDGAKVRPHHLCHLGGQRARYRRPDQLQRRESQRPRYDQEHGEGTGALQHHRQRHCPRCCDADD